MSLQDEIAKHRAEIRSDGYSMSVGELISLYQQEEVEIRPQFQRYFRWSEFQKSRLIESLLLGIPIPSVFMSQRADGVWDVIDGQQRLCTIFEFVGVLRNEQGELVEPLILEATKYLPSLEGRSWAGPAKIGRDNQLLIKRSKIDVKIILRESSEGSKYELFQRLNTGGSPLSRQEMRNVIAMVIDRAFYEWMDQLADNPAFCECADLSERQLEEQYDRELVLRFLVLGGLTDSALHIGDLGDFLDDATERLAGDPSLDRDREARIFVATFEALKETYGSDIFKRFDQTKTRHSGKFLISAFEAFAIGLSWHFRHDLNATIDGDRFRKVVRETWTDDDFTGSIGSGVRASTRIPNTILYARERLKQCLSEQS